MIYLDNASTTNFKPQRVVDSVKECMTKWPFNPNRSGNALATEMQKRLYKLRKKLSLLYCNASIELGNCGQRKAWARCCFGVRTQFRVATRDATAKKRIVQSYRC